MTTAGEISHPTLFTRCTPFTQSHFLLFGYVINKINWVNTILVIKTKYGSFFLVFLIEKHRGIFSLKK